MGKSGLVTSKIAATLASTGTPALFLHPAEAIHGDLGMIVEGDVVLALSQSGETEEILRLVETLRRLGVPLLAMTGRAGSPARPASADCCSTPRWREEACPLGLAPTASTTATLALGDALAMALLDARGFSRGGLRAPAPGRPARPEAGRACAELMHAGEAVPRVRPRRRCATRSTR